MEAASASEMLVNFYHNTQQHNPEDIGLHTRHSKNLKSDNDVLFLCLCP
jgi:hypothetical protein